MSETLCNFNSHVFIPVENMGKCAMCDLSIPLNKLGKFASVVKNDFARALITFMKNKPFWFGSSGSLLKIIHDIDQDPFGQKIVKHNWPRHHEKLKVLINRASTYFMDFGLIASSGMTINESIRRSKLNFEYKGKSEGYSAKRYENLTDYDLKNLNRFLLDVKTISDELNDKPFIASGILLKELKKRHRFWNTYHNPTGIKGGYGSDKGLSAKNLTNLARACKIRKRTKNDFSRWTIDEAYGHFKYFKNHKIRDWVELAWRSYMKSGEAYMANKIRYE
jgi:hypothetical protein